MLRRQRRWCGRAAGTTSFGQRVCVLPPAWRAPEALPSRAQVRRMDLEARSLPVGVKTPLLNKLRDYKARVAGLAHWAVRTQA